MSNSTQQTAPERIYLQTGCEPDESFDELSKGEVTWCANKVEETDVEYIRADLQKSRAIEFAEWISKTGYIQEENGAWESDSGLYHYTIATNTSELYKIFLEQSAG